MVWLKFILCACVILLAGRRLARDADVIALKTGMGGTFIGVILVAAVTSLPELFTGISSVTIVSAPSLTIGNLLGANTFNLLNLALLDIFSKKGLALKDLGRGQYLTALFGIVMVGIVGISILISQTISLPQIGWIGWYTPILVIFYLYFTRMLFRHERKQVGLKKEQHEFAPEYKTTSLKRAITGFYISAAAIIGAGIWLAIIGDEVVDATGLRARFVGSVFLAFSTTLPEITVSFTALRIGAMDLAVANMIGSSMINMAIVAIDDLLFLKGPILAYVPTSNAITAFVVILMMLVFIVGLLVKTYRWHSINWWNCSLIAFFLTSAYFSYSLNLL